MASTSTTTKTANSVWTDIAVGPSVLIEVAGNNVSGVDTLVALRLMRGTEAVAVIPSDLLPQGKGFRPRLPAFTLESSSHRLQALTGSATDWLVNATDRASAKQVSRVVKTSGDAWTTIWSGAGAISALMVSNTSMGEAMVSVRILKPSSNIVIVSPEAIEEGGPRRKLPVATLVAGESLQVKSIGGAEWVAFGVLP